MLRYAIAIVFVFATAASAAEPPPLAGPAIRELVAGATVEIDTPVGSKIPMQYAPHGTVAGDAPDLAFYLGAASDRGSWWVSGDRLCQKWRTWFDAATHCLQLRQAGNLIHWQREDGKTGTATIVRREPPPVQIATMTVLPVAKPAPAPSVQDSTPANDKAPVRADAVSPPATRPNPAGGSQVAAPKPVTRATVAVEASRPARAAKVSSAPPIRQSPSQDGAAGDASKAGSRTDTGSREPLFRVAGVDPSDTLYVRRGPSSEYAAIAAIAPEARGVQIIGPCRQEWCPITHRGVDGWVNSYYLAPEPAVRTGRRQY